MPPQRFTYALRLLLLTLTAALCLSCQGSTPDVAQASAPPKVVEARASFLAVGDIMLSRGVASRMASDPLLPFRRMEEQLKSTDFNFGNLESPFSGNDRVRGAGLVFNAHTRNVDGLVKYNFKVLNLANNHAFDQLLAGARFTRRYLDERGITHMGVGDSLEEAWRPKVVTAGGLNVGFIGASYASINDGGVARNDYVARIEDLDRLKASIQKLKAEADFIVVTMHAGTEYVAKPDPKRNNLDKWQIEFARAAIDYGADMVIGAHPHWIQNLEMYNGKPIFYSLGNFIFDQRQPLTNEGLTLKISLRGEKRVDPNQPGGGAGVRFATSIEQIECLPVIIEASSPRPATEAESERILKRMGLPRKVIAQEAAAAHN